MNPKSFGGSVAVTLSVINALAESGYDTILFTRDKINQRKLYEIMGERLPNDTKIIRKPSFLRSRNLINVYENAFKLLALKFKCDIVIDTYSCYIFPWSDVCYIHFPYINKIHFKEKFPYLIKRNGILSDTINLPYVFFEKNLENYSQKLLLANSRFTSSAIKEALKVDAKVLYPPVQSSFLQSLNSLEEEQRENFIVTVGRITNDKKIETIPEIASALREEDVKFLIVGFLHDKKILRKIEMKIEKLDLEEKIKILVNLSKNELKKILGRAKVYLHPPTIEHFGISIAEAMAMGCIPVVYHIGGAKEFVPEEFLYRDLQDAALKVQKAINKWSMKEAKKMNSRVQKFSEKEFRKRFIKIFSTYCSQLG